MTDPIQGVDLNPSKATTQANAASADQANQLSSLARVIGGLNSNEVSCKQVKGVITAVNLTASPPNCSAYINGDTSTAVNGIVFLDSYSPVVGDTVVMLAQGSEITIIGQYNDTGTGTANGWVAPTLPTGITTLSADPLMYRVVIDNGDRKVQLKGGIALNATQTVLWTMPTGIRPAANRVPFLVAQDDNTAGSSNTCAVVPQSDGIMRLYHGGRGIDNTQTGIGGGSAVTSTSGTGQTSFSGVQHYHIGNFDGANTSGMIANDPMPHSHAGPSHSHVGGNHQHPFTLQAYPNEIYFTGVSYYL